MPCITKERSILMDGKTVFTLLMLLLGTRAWAQPVETFATAMLVADPKAPLASVQKLTAILTAKGGHVDAVSSTGSFIQARFPGADWAYAVLEHADPGAPLQVIFLVCHTARERATALCEDIKQRYNAGK